jgi:HEAT repeat protein
LDFAALSDPALRIPLWGGIVTSALALVLLAYIAYLKLRLLADERRRQRFLDAWQAIMVRSVESLPPVLPALRRSEEMLFLALWNHFQESLRGEAKERLNALARQCGMDLAARRMLHRRRLYFRLLAAVALGHLRDAPSWDRLFAYAREPHPLLSMTAARSLGLIDAQRALDALLPDLIAREDWPLAKVASVLAAIGPDAVSGPLVAALDTTPQGLLPRLVRLLDVTSGDRATPALQALLGGARDEQLVIACLKSRHLPRDPALIRPFVAHPAWAVRAQAARALGATGERADVPALTGLLCDPVWWVRYRAAQALYQLPGMDGEAIAGLRSQIRDGFARDMLAQVAAEQEAV